jgi:hypothetical protein
MTHFAESGAPHGELFVMTRLEDTSWDFGLVDEKGMLVAEPSSALCARCHAEAPYEGLFGLPAAARPGPAAQDDDSP